MVNADSLYQPILKASKGQLQTVDKMHTISKLCLLLHSLQSQFEFLVLISQSSGVSLHHTKYT